MCARSVYKLLKIDKLVARCLHARYLKDDICYFECDIYASLSMIYMSLKVIYANFESDIRYFEGDIC